MRPATLKSRVRAVLPILFAASLAACGGGSDSGGKGYFAVTANLTKNGVTQIATVCVDGIAFYDPASAKGKDYTNILMRNYGLSLPSNTQAGEGTSCREKFASLYAILTVDEFNRLP